ncbi:hypothetical protein AB5J49_42490 [Streptomyces sp. R28]|uniref:Uncharacterized protein n=1 Tax=Streptomyces sp. R28 TaxID=3238628 RepID=A0AB39Q8A2_9ACTN
MRVSAEGQDHSGGRAVSGPPFCKAEGIELRLDATDVRIEGLTCAVTAQLRSARLAAETVGPAASYAPLARQVSGSMPVTEITCGRPSMGAGASAPEWPYFADEYKVWA